MEIKLDNFTCSIPSGYYNTNLHASNIAANYSLSGITGTMESYINGNKVKIDSQYLSDIIQNLLKQQEMLVEYLKFKGIYVDQEFKDFSNAYELADKLSDGESNE